MPQRKLFLTRDEVIPNSKKAVTFQFVIYSYNLILDGLDSLSKLNIFPPFFVIYIS